MTQGENHENFLFLIFRLTFSMSIREQQMNALYAI